MLGREFLENVRRGRSAFAPAILHRRGQFQVVVQNFCQLLGRVDVEWRPCEFPDLIGQTLQLLIEPARENSELRRIDANARAFHARQHRYQRQIDVVVNFPESPLVHSRPQHVMQSQRAIGPRFESRAEFLVEIFFGEDFTGTVARIRFQQKCREHNVVTEAFRFDAAFAEL